MANHLVFGAGLIGCYLGGYLSSIGFDVALLCRPTVRQKLLKGLKLTDYQNNLKAAIQVVFSENKTKYDVIWLTVKCTAVEQACVELKSYVGKNTIIFCCQNGLGSDQLVKAHFPEAVVLRVMVPFNVIEVNPGHLHRGSEGSLTLEKPEYGSNQIVDLSKQMNSSLLPVSVSNNMTALLWAKLQLNLGNSINALANIPVKEMLKQRPYRLVVASMMRELLNITKAKDIELPKLTALPAKLLPFVLELPTFLFERIANKMLAIDPTVRTSMWWDISLNKKTEIDYLNGAIMSEARLLGVECPVNGAVVKLVKQLEEGGSQNSSKSGYPYTGHELLQFVR